MSATTELRGRAGECRALDALIAGARAGRSGALVLRGEAGIGKTALLHYVLANATGCATARTAGVEAEMELAFAGLQQLCAPWLDRLERLPEPQREALGKAFGLHRGDPPDRFRIGLAVLSLLSDAAEQRPLVCVIDDAQWLDQASVQTLGFVARRVLAESVALVFAVRDTGAQDALTGLPELQLGGLVNGDARALLEAGIAGPLDARVRDRIVAETRGNPLALLEMPRGLTPEALAGGFGFPGAAALPDRIEASFQRRVASLPPATRRLLLVAAADPLGDPLLVGRAAERLGVAAAAADPAVAAGLLELGWRVRFQHPLVRSAVYRGSSPDERRGVHRALADATDPDVDPDRRAWHRAHATAGPDEDVAASLERSAQRARERSGLAAAAAFLERAAELTPEPARRSRRALAAARSKHEAGAPDAALKLLALAEAGPLNALDAARAERLRAQIAFAVTHGRDAPPLLLKAAKRLERLDARLARETYLDAFSAALFAGRLSSGGGVRDVAEAVRAADWSGSSGPEAFDLLLDGLAVLITEGYSAGIPPLARALRHFREDPIPDEDALRWLWLACRVARALGDDAGWYELSERQVRIARESGALALLPTALTEHFNVQLLSGDLKTATALVAEADAVIEATGSRLSPRSAITLNTWRGSEEAALALNDATRQDVARRGEGLWLASADWNRAVLCNGLGRYEDALVAAERAAAHPHELGFTTWVWPELIEAAARSGNADRAVEPLRRFTEVAQTSGTPWVLGIEARSRALVSEGDAAEALYREALDHLGRTRIRVALARGRLNYGEWLRRENRRAEAREQLHGAYALFVGMGYETFAERTRRELIATGATVHKRTAQGLDELTGQEAQIARYAAEGQTNPEIGAALFLSPRTVEWHLRKVFGKLGVSSRRELGKALA